MPRQFASLIAVAALFTLAIVVGVTFPRPAATKPLPAPPPPDLARIGCAYITDVGDSHGMPVTSCAPAGRPHLDGDQALVRYRIVQLGSRYTLRLRFVRSVWQVTAAQGK